jgi:AraC-like DNA-binding protein
MSSLQHRHLPDAGGDMISPRVPANPEEPRGLSRCEELLHPTLLYCEHEEKAGMAEINGRPAEIRTGDCLMLPARSVVHADVWLRIDRVVALDRPEGWIATFVAQFPRDPVSRIQRISVPECDRSRWVFALERLHFELTAKAPRGGEAAQAVLTLLAVDAARCAGVIAPSALSTRRVIAEVFQHMNSHLAAPISLREIANAVNFSPAYLTALMKRETGRSIVSWIIELRLEQAEQLLLSTDQPISQIAATVGYVDANSFGRAFTKRRGVSPWQWRRCQLAARSATP